MLLHINTLRLEQIIQHFVDGAVCILDKNFTEFVPIYDPIISGGLSRLVTSDLAESPILSGQEFQCATAMECNHDVS